MVTAGTFPFKENSHGRAGNQTQDLMVSSQRLWPLDHEAGHTDECLNSEIKGHSTPTFILILKFKRSKPARQSSMSSCTKILRQAVLTQNGRRN